MEALVAIGGRRLGDRPAPTLPGNAHSADLASPRGVGLPSAGEQHDPGSVAFRQFLIARVEDGVHCFSQSDVRGIIGGEIVPQFPNTANQWGVRITLGRQRRESREKLIATMCPYSLTSH